MRIAVIYWSGSGNTEEMAKYIAEGASAELFEVSSAPTDLSGYDKLAFGCPAMGAEELEDTVFEPYFSDIESQLTNKPVAIFGSYGWGDGEWMRSWKERLIIDNAIIFSDGLMASGKGDKDECVAFGADFAKV